MSTETLFVQEYAQEKRKITDIEQLVLALEKGSLSVDAATVASELQGTLGRLNNLDKMVLQESKSRQEDYKRKVLFLRSSYEHAKSGLHKYMKKQSSKVSPYAYQRDTLLQGSRDPSIVANGGGDFDVEQAETASLNRSTRMVNSYIESAQESMAELYSQGNRLKGVQRKVLDIMGYLGLSDTIMKNANRRDSVDRIIVYGGMLFTLLLIFVIWKYFR
jgi:Golgi SNAP receptor complex protein 2